MLQSVNQSNLSVASQYVLQFFFVPLFAAIHFPKAGAYCLRVRCPPSDGVRGGFFTAPSTVAVFRFCLIHKNYGAGSRYDLPGERHTLNVQLLRQIVAGVEIGLRPRLVSSDVAPYAAPAIFPGSILLSVGIDHTYGLLRQQLKFCPHKRSRLIYCYLCQR